MQTRIQTLIEVVVSTAVGFLCSVLIGYYLYPFFGHKFSVLDKVLLTGAFTIWSLFRSYWLRRFFNWLFGRGKLAPDSTATLKACLAAMPVPDPDTELGNLWAAARADLTKVPEFLAGYLECTAVQLDDMQIELQFLSKVLADKIRECNNLKGANRE